MAINLPSVRNIDVKGKRVLLRVDFNVLFSDGKVEDLYRITRTIPTIEYLSRKGAKVIIISHLSPGKNGSLASVAKYLNSIEKSFHLGFIKATDLSLIAEKIFIGGALANNCLQAKGMDIGSSVLSENIPVEKYISNEKIYFPTDVRKKDGKIYDIGEKAVEEILSLVQEAKFILWSGPMGNIEEDDFDKGTKIIAEAIAGSTEKTK